ncbi:MAG: hypothetical protein HDR07_01460 [Lachnospiraceae bacterium]|nr:hypothetical protein [Lachnospiraceae bacterium]
MDYNIHAVLCKERNFMDKIKRYVENFFKETKADKKYQMCTNEMEACKNAMTADPFRTICTLFNYGYAKGYRAAVAEMKKGGRYERHFQQTD